MAIATNIKSNTINTSRKRNTRCCFKTKPVSDLMEAYDSGQRIFWRNKIQEMADKWEQMPKDIHWHMMGHVQSNKVKYMAPFVQLVHGVDSLLQE
jgi:uncharacterized pyridoxal phosphate-containing UPF0001 family protein